MVILTVRPVPTPVLWYKVLCAWLGVCNIAIFALGSYAYRFVPPDDVDPNLPVGILKSGGVMLMGLAVLTSMFLVWCATAKPSKFQWALAASNIIGGLVFCLPLSLLLLKPWYSDEIKAYYGVI